MLFLQDRRRAHLLNFRFIRKTKPGLLNVREVRTRAHDAPLFNVNIPRCEAFKRSVDYFGAIEWNNLTVEPRNIDLYLPFRYHMRTEMLKPLTAVV